MQYFFAQKIVLPDKILEDGYLGVEEGVIRDITIERPFDHPITDLGPVFLAPGLVDTHIHGFLGYDVMDGDSEGLKRIAEGLPSAGVTSWVPTTLTASDKELQQVCHVIGEHYKTLSGAKIRGIFFEGPFFTEKYKGAQNPNYMLDPDIEKFQRWRQLADNLLIKIAIAPERRGAVEFTRQASALGIKISLGHSDATYAEAKACVDAGATIFNHVYNGMSGLHHREPGMVGAALSEDHVYCELICDGYHVHPAATKIVMKCAKTDHVVLVTDCMRAGGLGDGKSKLGEYDVIVKDGAARLENGGNLAGSILELKDAVKNVVDWGIATPFEAIQMASLVPAKSVGIDALCGKLAIGYPADFVTFNLDMRLTRTYIDGECVYSFN